MGSLRQWWRRAAAAVEDRRSMLLARARPRRPSQQHHRELEVAVIRATSHEERWMDYRSAARVFAWARTSPSFVRPAMLALAGRARRTQCWAVALKALLVAHGLLLHYGVAHPAARVGRVPFELADFHDRSAPTAKSFAFSAFVRAYFRFLDYRSLFAAQQFTDDDDDADAGEHSDHHTARLTRIAKLQFLLDLLMQIRPYGDGMEVPLVLEAMDCALVEIFQVYSEICTGVARFLVGLPGPAKPRRPDKAAAAAAAGVRMLRRAAEQSAQLLSYFELCRRLGVVNARRLPAFKSVAEDDVRNLERLLMGDADEEVDEQEEDTEAGSLVASSTVVTTTEWVAFEEENASDGGREARRGGHWNYPFVAAPWDVGVGRNLIDLS